MWQTKEKIYLVLEYCDGGDLAAYIHKHGKVSEAVARHFMRQLGISILLFGYLNFQSNFLLLKLGNFGKFYMLWPSAC